MKLSPHLSYFKAALLTQDLSLLFAAIPYEHTDNNRNLMHMRVLQKLSTEPNFKPKVFS